MCWQAFRVGCVVCINRPTGGKVADITSHATNSAGVEINFIRHWLDAKNLFAVNRLARGSAVGSGAGYLPDPSLACRSVAYPEVSLLVEGNTVSARYSTWQTELRSADSQRSEPGPI